MNATMLSNSPRDMPALAARLFWRSAASTTRWLVIGLVLLLAGLNLAFDAVPVLYLGTLALWWLWIPRLALMQRDAHRHRMPGASMETSASLLLATLPAIAFAFSGHGGNPHSSAWWLAVMVFTAAVGVIGSFLSLRTIGVLFMVHPWPLMAVYWMSKNGTLPADSLERLVRAAIGTDLGVWIVAAVLCTIATILWRRFVREEQQRVSWDRTPLILFSNDRPLDGASLLQNSGVLLATDPLSWWVKRETRQFGPQSPVLAMRTWLGSPFAPQTWQQIVFATTLALVLPFLLASNGIVGIITATKASEDMSAGILGIAVGVFMLSYLIYPYRIRQLMRRHSSELSELALLPGWGSAAVARRTLLRGMGLVLRNTLFQWVGVVLVGVAFVWNVSAVSPQQWALYLLLFLQPSGFVVLMCLCWLAGCRFHAGVEAALWLGGFGLSTVLWHWFHADGHLSWSGLSIAYIAVLGAEAAAARYLLQRFRGRPHPFLES